MCDVETVTKIANSLGVVPGEIKYNEENVRSRTGPCAPVNIFVESLIFIVFPLPFRLSHVLATMKLFPALLPY